MIHLQRIIPDDWQAFRALRQEALREAPHAFGSTLAEWQGAGDTEERWRARLTSVPHNVVAHLDGEPAGIVGGTAPDANGTVELISMWVAPFARGRGVGDALVQSVIAWARTQRANAVLLAVKPGNEHALSLYRRHGFTGGAVVDGELTFIHPL